MTTAIPLMSIHDQDRGPSTSKYVVPWKSRKEFLDIYNKLYSEDYELQERAVKWISMWKARAGSRLSVAVENTGTLFDIILQHLAAVRENKVNERETLLRSSFGLAVVRFVNFVTEKGQTKQTAQPVHSLAREFGIPEWIVRIRHDVTHNILPSLDILSTAANWAVQYLREEFWDNQTHESADIMEKYQPSGRGKMVSRIRKSLCAYQTLRAKEIAAQEEELDPKNSTHNITQVILKEYLKQDRFNFLNCVLKDGFFIPNEEQLETYGTSKEEIMHQASPRLPTSLLEFWQPILAIICGTKSMAAFSKIAMFCLSEEDCLRNYLLAGWLDFLLHNASNSRVIKTDKKGRSRKNLVFGDALRYKKLLLSLCLQNVNKYTIHLLTYVMDREEIGEEAYQQLSKLLQYTPQTMDEYNPQSSSEDEDVNNTSVYTTEDVQGASVPHEEEDHLPLPALESVQDSVREQEVGWKICTRVVDWSKIPLGTIPCNEEDEAAEEEHKEEEEEEEDENCGDEEIEEKNSQENRFAQNLSKEGDSSKEDCEDDDDDDDDQDTQHSRDWKRSQRKRSHPEDNNSDRSGAKLSTSYVVNDTELL